MPSYIELDENGSLPPASGPGRVVLGIDLTGGLNIIDSNGTSSLNTQTFATTGSNAFVGDQIITSTLTQGFAVTASGDYSHAEGEYSTASANFSHAEGRYAVTLGVGSHAEGSRNMTIGGYSHAEGHYTTASGWFSHAEGNRNVAGGTGAHAEGYTTFAQGNWSHTEGLSTTASGDYSHAGGVGTIAATTGQHALGKYNLQDNTSSLFVVGGGLNSSSRRDIFDARIDVNGSGSIMMPYNADAPLNPTTGSMYWSGSFIYLYDGSTWKSASLS
jgi:hypothetical protein